MTATALPAPPSGVETGDRAATAGKPPRPENRAGWLFATPFLALYLAFLIGPVVIGLLISLFNTTTVKSGIGSWVGFSNYADVLTNADFWASMWHSALFTLLTTPILVLLPLLFAVLVSRLARGQTFYRLAFFAPYVLPSAVMALIWKWLYTPELGLIENALSKIGIAAPSWLGDPIWAMPSLALATVWWTLGFNFVLYLAGLQDIPRELYEAAALDGASPWQQIRRITIPLLGRTTTLVAVLQVIASLKVFDQMYIMTQGGPNFATRSALMYIYDETFTNFRAGYGAAVSMLFFLVVLAVSVVWFWLVRQREEV
jgi:multiple sugar transport system permease protein